MKNHPKKHPQKHRGKTSLRDARPGLVAGEGADAMLHTAIRDGDVKLVAVLLGAGADATAPVKGGATPLHDAVRAKISAADKRMIAEMLLASGADISARDERGYTPLHYASFYGVPEMCSFLVENGARLDARDCLKNTPLHWGIKAKDAPPVVLALLQLGAKVDSCNGRHRTPVEVARAERRDEALGVIQRVISMRHTRRVKHLSIARRHRPAI